MIGYGAVFLALIATVVAAVYYLKSHSSSLANRAPKLKSASKGGRWYQLSAALIGAAAVYLLGLILAGQYQYAYVYSYSSRDLSLAYKFSAFWAGQEGSFLLWAVFHALFGLVLLRRRDNPPAVMAVYSVLQAFLLLFILVKSPFMMLAQLPGDGAGLNPLLQDPWMVIHPPIVFLGYAGLAVPFAYALGGLMARSHHDWLGRALPWALLSWGALGAGIFIGGFWAYKVLGWGGYWAWDPVENSSLVPWVVAGVLVHLLFLARVRPSGIPFAYLGGIFSFVLVLYGTFLTRSGVLSDFSTHSFADEGAGGLLAGSLLVITVVSLVFLILRWEELPKGELYPALMSREFMLACSALVMTMFAALVLIGMSTPVFTVLLGNAQNVSASFYNTTSMPLAAALSVLLAVGAVITWGTNEGQKTRRYWWALVAAHGGILLTVSYGIYHPLLITVVFFSVAAVLMNLFGAVRQMISIPAAVTHIGVAVMLIGIVMSSAGSQTTMVTFEKGDSKPVFGHTLTYTGVEKVPDGKGFYQNFTINGSAVVKPLTKLNKEGVAAAREPGIYRTVASDLYLAPVMKNERGNEKKVNLRKGEETVLEGLGLKYIRAGMSTMPKGQDDVHIQAVLQATFEGRMSEIVPEMAFHSGKIEGNPVPVFGQYEITLIGINPNDGMITLLVYNRAAPAPIEALHAEISYKPLINLVWLGTALITIGTCWAGIRRLQ